MIALLHTLMMARRLVRGSATAPPARPPRCRALLRPLLLYRVWVPCRELHTCTANYRQQRARPGGSAACAPRDRPGRNNLIPGSARGHIHTSYSQPPVLTH
jgi:hypothetical protein